jgi:hypothetical protein
MPTTELDVKIKKVKVIMEHYQSLHPEKSEEFLGEKFNELLDAEDNYLDELKKIIENG